MNSVSFSKLNATTNDQKSRTPFRPHAFFTATTDGFVFANKRGNHGFGLGCLDDLLVDHRGCFHLSYCTIALGGIPTFWNYVSQCCRGQLW